MADWARFLREAVRRNDAVIDTQSDRRESGASPGERRVGWNPPWTHRVSARRAYQLADFRLRARRHNAEVRKARPGRGRVELDRGAVAVDIRSLPPRPSGGTIRPRPEVMRV